MAFAEESPGSAPRASLFPGAIDRALTSAERQKLRVDLRAMLAWQKDLDAWRRPTSAIDALPYIALYARGRLFGCYGAEEGAPDERLGRAFLRALLDVRFGGLPAAARPELAAEVSFVARVREIDPDEIEATFEVGTHGLGVARAGEHPVILLPGVARDHGYRARAMLESLVRKAKVEMTSRDRFFVFETERAVARASAPRMRRLGPRDAAAAWMGGLVGADGAVCFGVDARNGSRTSAGVMHHARVAAAIQALDLHGAYASKVRAARRRLASDARRAMSGDAVEAWPEDPAQVAGTLAHLLRAGVAVKDALLSVATAERVSEQPWHAGQVAAALGAATPPSVVKACMTSLDAEPWAPWTVLAAAKGKGAWTGEALSRGVRALVDAVRSDAPHKGGIARQGIPEIAITALTVEALKSVRASPDVVAAITRAEGFLERWQVSAEDAPAAFDVASSAGAFVGTPVSSGLRADVTGHAYLALWGKVRRAERNG